MALPNPHIFKDTTSRNMISRVTFLIISASVLLLRLIVSAEIASVSSHLVYLVFFMAGLWFGRKLLLLYFSDLVTALSITILCYGTNLFYVAAFDAQWQALTLFTLYAILLYLVARWSETQKVTHLILLTVVTGLIILFQPTGYLSVFILLLWGVSNKASLKQKMRLFYENRRELLWCCIALLIFILLSIIIFRIAPGEIPFLSFNLPGAFVLGSKYVFKYLLDIDHGLLLYTPLVFVILIGFLFLARKRPHLFFAVFVFALLDLIVETSWSRLYQTGCFGQIAFIPLYAVLLLPLSSLIEKLGESRWVTKIAGSMVILLFVLLSMFQTWQFTQGILTGSGMSPVYYRAVFGQTTIPEKMQKMAVAMNPGRNNIEENLSDKNTKTLMFEDFEDPGKFPWERLEQKFTYRGRFAFPMDSVRRYSPGFRATYEQFYEKDSQVIRCIVFVYLRNANDALKTNLVATSVHKDSLYNYQFLNLSLLKNLRFNAWNEVRLDYLPSANPQREDQLRVNVTYEGNSVIFLDDFKVELLIKK